MQKQIQTPLFYSIGISDFFCIFAPQKCKTLKSKKWFFRFGSIHFGKNYMADRFFIDGSNRRVWYWCLQVPFEIGIIREFQIDFVSVTRKGTEPASLFDHFSGTYIFKNNFPSQCTWFLCHKLAWLSKNELINFRQKITVKGVGGLLPVLSQLRLLNSD